MEKDKSKNCEINWFFINDFFEDARTFRTTYKKEVSGDSYGKYTSTFFYDDKTQKLILLKDSTGDTKYSFYINGNLKSITYPDGKKISYSYDMQGAIILIIDILNNKTIYNYSKSNAKLESSEFISSITNERQIEKYFYDKFGRIYYKLLPNEAKTIYKYNDINGLEKLTHFVNDKQILSYSYTYYKDMNIASRIRTEESGLNSLAKESYSYDSLNNLLNYFCTGILCPKDQNKNTIVSEKYSFDEFNNIKAVKVSYADGKSSLTQYYYLNKDPVKLTGYSISSSIINKSYTIDYDNEGNIIKDGDGNIFIYSPFNRLEKFISDGKVTEYFYNGSGALVYQKTENTNEESRYYYNEERVLNEISSGIVISYFQVSGRIIGKKTDRNDIQIFLTDQAHSVIRILEGKKLINFNVAYTPYGQSSDVTEKSNHLKISNIGFNGERTDSKTKFQFLGQGFRAYNPILGRFMQYDSNSPFGKGGINGYIFAENNPIMNFDSTGESASSYAVMGVGILLAIIGIVASVISFGSSLGLTAVGGTITTTASTTQIALASTSLVTGVASGATGIASAIYTNKADMASIVGDKSAAEYYANTASVLGWASLALGVVSAVSGIASSIASSSNKSLTTSSLASSEIIQPSLDGLELPPPLLARASLLEDSKRGFNIFMPKKFQFNEITKAGNYRYVIKEDGNVIFGLSNDFSAYANGSHAGINDYNNALGAGYVKIIINKNKLLITDVTKHSGHYQPDLINLDFAKSYFKKNFPTTLP